MFGKIKNILGIEGVKIELEIPDTVELTSQIVTGKVLFYTKNTQEVEYVQLKFIEQYTRGRGDDKRTNEYELGLLNMNQTFVLPAGEMLSVDFELPFTMVRSEMDELENKNIVLGGLVKMAKYFEGVKSIYRIEATAKVKGTTLNPFVKEAINLV